MREPVSSPFTSFLAQHFDQINDYLATFFDGQATSADIERYLYAPLSLLRPTPASAPPAYLYARRNRSGR